MSVITACGPAGDGAAACGELTPRNDDEVALCNGLEQAVIAAVALPAGTAPAGGWPGVVLLHGSSGLFLPGDDICSETPQDQFRIWSDLLTAQGYAVIMPSSFYSRGFCDTHKTGTVPREFTDHEQLVVRTFDAVAAGQWLCDDARVDCSKLAMLGFSNGASTAMLALQDRLDTAEDSRLHQLRPDVPSFVGAVAYYPGCGLEGELADNLGTAEEEAFYYPQAPIWVPHAAEDNLLGRCEELRDPQVDFVADERGVSRDMFELEVYAGAKHGFDVWFTGDPQADLTARTAAQSETLARLDEWMKSP